jgi:hypothetical protein
MVIYHRLRGYSFVILGVKVVFSLLHICFVGDYSHESDYKFYTYSLISFCGVMNCGEIIVYVVSCVEIRVYHFFPPLDIVVVPVL